MQRGWLRSEREADVLLNLENSGRAKAKALSLRARVEKRKKTVSKKRARILKIHSTRFIVGVFLNGKKKEKERKERKESGRDRSKSELTKSSFQTVSFDRSRSTRKKRKKKRRNVIFSLSFFRGEATLSNRVMPPWHSSARFTRSLPRSRPPDSSSVSIERTWLSERIRCAYVYTCARVLHHAITRPRKKARRMLVQANNQRDTWER